MKKRKTHSCNESASLRRYLPSALMLMAVALITLAVALAPIETEQLVKLGLIGIFLANLLGSLTVIFPAPAILTAFAGGIWLNPVWAGLLAGLGSGLGEISGYLVGYSGKPVIENQQLYGRIRPWMARNGFITLLVLAALPNPLFDMAGITAGAMGFPFLKFVVATCAGKMVKGLTLAFLGAESSKLLGPLLR